jgi:threonine/homoserine/homoserine lactone efflux protein
MVTLRSVVLFVAASVPLILFPGPAVSFIVTTTLRRGRRSGFAATCGVETGYLLHVLGAVVGVSAIIATTAVAFSVVKIAGVCWLLWLAWRGLRSSATGTIADLGAARSQGVVQPEGAGSFTRGLLVGALNPKTAMFYLAFLPQFVTPDAGAVWLQLLFFGLLFIALALCFDSLWVVAGGGLRRLLPALRLRLLDRASGAVYAALAVVLASVRRVGAAVH